MSIYRNGATAKPGDVVLYMGLPGLETTGVVFKVFDKSVWVLPLKDWTIWEASDCIPTSDIRVMPPLEQSTSAYPEQKPE